MDKGFGEGNVEKIKVLGAPFESLKSKFDSLLKGSKKMRA
jgi:hypothetical protein